MTSGSTRPQIGSHSVTDMKVRAPIDFVVVATYGRATGANFFGYVDTDGTTCPTGANVTGQMGSTIIDGASIDCANDLLSAGVVFGDKGQKQLVVLAWPRVHTIRVSTPNTESIAPVQRNPEGQYGLTLFPPDTPDTEFFHIEGIIEDGQALGNSVRPPLCRYADPNPGGFSVWATFLCCKEPLESLDLYFVALSSTSVRAFSTSRSAPATAFCASAGLMDSVLLYRAFVL